MNLFAKTLSPTTSVGTMLLVGTQYAATMNGRTKPKTRTKAIRSVTKSSRSPDLPFFIPRSRRSWRDSRRRFVNFSAKRFHSTLECPDARWRPESHKRLALYVLDGQRPKHPGVRRVRPVVPHYKDLPLGQSRRAEEAVVRVLAVEVGFVLGLPVHQKGATTHLDLVPRHPHHALYQVLFPAVYALKDDDISSLGLGKAVDELVHEDPVPTSSVGTMLSEGMRNASRTKGRTNPKTRAKATASIITNSRKPPASREEGRPGRPSGFKPVSKPCSEKRFSVTIASDTS